MGQKSLPGSGVEVKLEMPVTVLFAIRYGPHPSGLAGELALSADLLVIPAGFRLVSLGSLHSEGLAP